MLLDRKWEYRIQDIVDAKDIEPSLLKFILKLLNEDDNGAAKQRRNVKACKRTMGLSKINLGSQIKIDLAAYRNTRSNSVMRWRSLHCTVL